MSKFFKALEQAELEHALRKQAGPPEGSAKTLAPPAPPGSTWDPGQAPSPPPAEHRAEEGRPPHAAGRPAGPVGATSEVVDGRLVSLLAPTSFAAEQYRALRHLVEQLHKTADLSVVAVSSPDVGDGKTTTAINLAGTLAQSPGARVLLVDADLRRASVARHLGLGGSDQRGLVDAILDAGLPLEGVVQRLPTFNLSVLPAGRRSPTPYEVLNSPRLGELLEAARGSYTYIVLDTPPLVPIPDCRLIGKWVDGFLVVVTAHKTPRKLVAEALDTVDPTKIVGLLFNDDDRPLSAYYSIPAWPSAGDRADWWGHIVKKAGRAFRRRRAFRPRWRRGDAGSL